MRIGFYTSTFNDRPVEEVLDFAAEAGFDAIEIDIGGHVADPDAVAGVVEDARARGLFVSSLTLFGNQLDPDPAARRARRDLTRAYAAAAAGAGVPFLVLFPGRDPKASEDDDYRDIADHALSLLDDTGDLGIAFENWPGMANDYIAVTPSGWERLFALASDPRIGIEFDPSHLIRLGINPFEALEGVRDRVKILHGKDTLIDRVRLQSVGYHGDGWWRYVLPGRGELDWAAFLGRARALDVADVLSIEHEDADFGWPKRDLAARREGERQALAFLRAAAA